MQVSVMRFAVPNTVQKTDIGNNNLAVGPSGSHDCSSQLQRRERTPGGDQPFPLSFDLTSPPQTVLKVSARVEKSVPLYRGDNEFSILTGGTFTFKTVSPIRNDTGVLYKDDGRFHPRPCRAISLLRRISLRHHDFFMLFC